MNDMTHIVERQRAVQQQVQKADKARPPEEMKGAMQAGARRYPEPPFPRQLLEKPGLEEDQDVEEGALLEGLRQARGEEGHHHRR